MHASDTTDEVGAQPPDVAAVIAFARRRRHATSGSARRRHADRRRGRNRGTTVTARQVGTEDLVIMVNYEQAVK
jgi:hypothetical protein